MAARIVIGMLAFAGVIACALASVVTWNEMVTRVNARLPAGERFEAAWWYYPKTQRLWVQYRRLDPDGRLDLRYLVTITLAVGLMAACVWSVGLLGT